MQPDISVLIPAYEPFANYPYGQLWSGAAAAYRSMGDVNAVEIVVCDDASPTDGQELAEWCKDAGIALVRHETNRGVAAALNTAAETATGRYIIVQSVRSWYEPGAFRVMVNALDQHPEIGFVYGQTQYHGIDSRRHTPPAFDRARFFRNFDSLFGYMYRREALDICHYAPYLEREGRYIDVSDYDFIMQLIVKMEWSGLALRDQLCLHYLYSGTGQMTNLVHKYQREIDQIFRERWGVGV